MQDDQKLPLVPAQLAALLQPDQICLNLQAQEKLPALRELVTSLRHHPALARPEAFFRELLARERVTNTALGNGLAMPHARTDLCDDIVIAVGRSTAGIDYDAPDGKPVHLLFMIGTPQRELTRYHQLVVGLARMLNRAANRERLLAATDAADFIRVMATLRC
jgi:mannitol/fructose-specific phosphotransferase system IIA component (Ntr-type)